MYSLPKQDSSTAFLAYPGEQNHLLLEAMSEATPLPPILPQSAEIRLCTSTSPGFMIAAQAKHKTPQAKHGKSPAYILKPLTLNKSIYVQVLRSRGARIINVFVI